MEFSGHGTVLPRRGLRQFGSGRFDSVGGWWASAISGRQEPLNHVARRGVLVDLYDSLPGPGRRTSTVRRRKCENWHLRVVDVGRRWSTRPKVALFRSWLLEEVSLQPVKER